VIKHQAYDSDLPGFVDLITLTSGATPSIAFGNVNSVVAFPAGITVGATKYVNWGTSYGAAVPGIRLDTGALEFSNDGVSWTAFSTATSYWNRTGTVLSPATAGDTLSGGSNILEVKNGATAQTFNVYGNATRYVSLYHDADQGILKTSYGALFLGTVGNVTMKLDTSNNLLWVTDGGGNIGALADSRPNDLFLKRNATIGGTLTAPTVTTGGTYGVQLNGDTIVFDINYDADAGGSINYEGYNNGTTRYRSLGIYDGKHGRIAYFAGSTKLVTLDGALTVTGSATIQGLTVGLGANAVAGNTAVGVDALKGANSGTGFNVALGHTALSANTSGAYGVAVGFQALATHQTGNNNVAIGSTSLYNNVTGAGNVALGYFAGAYETGSNAFYVDNQDRTNTAGDKAGALIYGTFNATPANQTLTFNAAVNTPYSLAIGTNPASAGSIRLANAAGVTWGSAGSSTPLMSGVATDFGSMATDAVAALPGTQTGFVVIGEDGGGSALFYLHAGATIRISEYGSIFSATKDNAATINVYYDSGFKVQNKYASALRVRAYSVAW
jgi:hypothetical protein